MADGYTVDTIATPRGYKKYLAKSSGLKYSVLCKDINRRRIYALLPGILKSKAEVLHMLPLDREVVLFDKIYDARKRHARELRTKVHEWNALLSRNPRLLLTDIQHDVIMGTLLGDANVRNRGKNSQYRVMHTDKQARYLYLLHDHLSEFTNNVLHLYQRKSRSLELYFETMTHPLFNYYFNLFYQGGVKRVSSEILAQLTPRALAMWICDDGSYSAKGKQLVLCTNSYSLEEHILMKTYFENTWHLKPVIAKRDGRYFYLRFTKADTEKLVSLVKEFIPKSMKYKIGEQNA